MVETTSDTVAKINNTKRIETINKIVPILKYIYSVNTNSTFQQFHFDFINLKL